MSKTLSKDEVRKKWKIQKRDDYTLWIILAIITMIISIPLLPIIIRALAVFIKSLFVGGTYAILAIATLIGLFILIRYLVRYGKRRT